MKTPEAVKQLTALQRIETLEGALAQTIDAAQTLVQENATLKAQVLELSAQIKAIIEVQGIQESVNKDIVKQNVEELKGRITKLLESKEIEPCDIIGPKSFVAAKMLNKEGLEANPRIQFAMESIEEDVRQLLLDKKVGDEVQYNDSKVIIMEVYKATQE